MKTKILKVMFVVFLSLTIASISLAQRYTGSVSGIVLDEEGMPLPGAVVNLTGPNIMGILSYTTTESGDFRFPTVPPGRDVVVTVEMPGFQKVVRVGLVINVGKTIRVDIELKPVTLSEEITVTAPSPTIDVSSTKQTITYSKELIEAIPLDRNYYAIIEAAPGVTGSGYGPSVHGSGGRTSLAALDGVNITDRALGNQAYQFSFDVIEEVELETGGHPAEVGMTDGAYINMVSKSGGNEFSGSSLVYFYNDSMVRSLLSERQLESVGVSVPTGLKSLYDFSGTFGGPIIKDKLWFFSHARLSGNKSQEETLQDGPFDLPRLDRYGFLKLTLQASSNFKFTGMASILDYDNELGYWNINYYAQKYSRNYIKHAKNIIALGMVS